jgi:hypothetical protein
MHLHTLQKKKLISFPFQTSGEKFIIAKKPRKRVVKEPAPSHAHGTRANYQRNMDEVEQLRQNNAALREDFDGMKEKMDQMLEFMQAMANKERNLQPVVNETDTTWPPYGLPPNYTPPTESGGPSQPPPVTLTIPVVNANPPTQEATTGQNENTHPLHVTEGAPSVCPLPNQLTPVVAHPEV